MSHTHNAEIVGMLPINTPCKTIAELRGRLRVKEFDLKKGGRVKLGKAWYRVLTTPSLFIPKAGDGDPGTTMVVRRSRCRNSRNNERLTICLRTQGGTLTVGIPEGCREIYPHPDAYYSLAPLNFKRITSKKPNEYGTWTERDKLGRIIVHDEQECAQLAAKSHRMQIEETAEAERQRVLKARFAKAEKSNDFSGFTFEEKKRYLEDQFTIWAEKQLEKFLDGYVKKVSKMSARIFNAPVEVVQNHMCMITDTGGAERSLRDGLLEGISDTIWCATTEFDPEDK